MPYDKGDFTQQGCDGKVSGGLLLNNKRDVDVLVSTNEDDSTLSLVAVTVEDHLNDLKYAFWGENLEAGEVYEIGAGGGGDFTTASLTVTVEMPENPQESIYLNLPIVYEAEGDIPAGLFCVQTEITESGTYDYTIALYKGLACIMFSGNYVSSSGDIERQGPTCLVTGNATLSIMGLS